MKVLTFVVMCMGFNMLANLITENSSLAFIIGTLLTLIVLLIEELYFAFSEGTEVKEE